MYVSQSGNAADDAWSEAASGGSVATAVRVGRSDGMGGLGSSGGTGSLLISGEEVDAATAATPSTAMTAEHRQPAVEVRSMTSRRSASSDPGEMPSHGSKTSSSIPGVSRR